MGCLQSYSWLFEQMIVAIYSVNLQALFYSELISLLVN